MNVTNHRPDIDGLRGIAVTCVLLFHVGVETFKGGYIGVDVFFVISGFLITGLIRDEVLTTGRFNFSNFYIRRIRRLFPALFVTLGLSFVAAAFLFIPQFFERFGLSLISVLLGVSNVFFWRESDYFAIDARFHPLLHTWSLGIEEQFYLIWPAVLVFLLLRIPRLGSLIFLLCLGIFSFWLNLAFASSTSNSLASFLSAFSERFADGRATIFYLTPFRIFELVIGGVTVWCVQCKPKNEQALEPVAILGMAMIFYSVFNYSKDTLFPSYSALLPCFGSALLIYSGTARYAGLLLRNKLSVGVGLVSYSLYLVHWPIIVFYKYWTLDDLSELEKLMLLIVSMTLATSMYRYVEQPFRRGFPHVNAWQPPRVFAVTVLFAVCLVVPSTHAWMSRGWDWRFTNVMGASGLATEAEFKKSYQSFQSYCNIGDGFEGNCDFERENRILIVGDSHINAWHFAFSEVFRNENTEVFGLSYLKCNTDFHISGESVSSNIAENGCDKKAAFLTEYKDFLSSLDSIILASHRPFSYQNNPFRFELLRYLSSFSPNVKLFVLGNYYQTDMKTPCEMVVQREEALDACLRPKFVKYVGTYQQVKTEPWFSKLDPSAYTFIDYTNLLCETIEECPYETNGIPFMLDWNHVTHTFAKQALESIRQKHPSYFKKLGIEK